MIIKAKKDTWFNEGTIVKCISDFRPDLDSGLFEGLRTCENPSSESRILGEIYLDEEMCEWDEFEIINE